MPPIVRAQTSERARVRVCFCSSIFFIGSAKTQSSKKKRINHLVVSFAALVEAVPEGPLAVCEELQPVPYLRLHSGGFREARPQRSDSSLQLPPPPPSTEIKTDSKTRGRKRRYRD